VLVECEAGELYKQPATIVIDGQTGKKVSFAEDEAATGGWQGEIEESTTKFDGIVDECVPELVREGLGFFPGIEPDGDATVGVEESPGDEVAIVSDKANG
jgi:hypothetical protein